jgi:hypothetical protein
LAYSDRANGGWPSGRISNPIGDTDTSKTVRGCGALAEACQLPAFDEWDLVYAGCESDLSFHPAKMFGRKFSERVTVLSNSNEDPNLRPPATVEEWHYQMLERFNSGRPFAYVLDSLDSLPSEAELKDLVKRFGSWKSRKDEDKDAKKVKGSYNMSKQKYMSQMLREIRKEIEATDSIIMIISQVRMNIDAQYDPYTRSGGKALDFYARIISWTFINYQRIFKYTDVVRGETVAKWIKEEVSKNHITGKKRTVPYWVYDAYGIQDVLSNIYWLMLKGHWKKDGSGRVDVKEWGTGSILPKELSKFVYANKKERELRRMVQKVWDDIEKACEPPWEPKYQ